MNYKQKNDKNQLSIDCTMKLSAIWAIRQSIIELNNSIPCNPIKF